MRHRQWHHASTHGLRKRGGTGALLIALALVAAGCGSDESSSSSTSAGSASSSPTTVPATTVPATTVPATTVPATTVPATTVPATTVPATTVPETTEPAATTTAPVVLAQPAIWPAADVVFETPEAAAEDFVTVVLGIPPVLGEFMQGDSRSGEIEVFSAGEGAGPTPVRGLLLLRQLAPSDGWFILAAANEHATIEEPESMAEVPAGEITVAGVARGYEANVMVTARIAGRAGDPLDMEVTMAGSLETAEPYSVTIDLSSAEPGDVVMLLVRGGAGLETDPGEFGAIPVVIAG